ncbi:MAG TPA: IPT/TIG domain-containing protein [Terriglobia bacterium]|nr:IPT/TIG domain-containing protein [Terriglobia bacterium]
MTLWKKNSKAADGTQRSSGPGAKPRIEDVTPRAVIPGGEIALRGRGFTENGHTLPRVRFGDQAGNLVLGSPTCLIVRVPQSATSGDVTVDTGHGVSAPASVAVGLTIAENLHPVANPAVDAAGNIFSTFSGSRGQKVPVAVFKVDNNRSTRPFLSDLMNATGLAFDREGFLYISSRLEGVVYRVTPDGKREVYAEGMGVATGLAFDGAGNLYVGDRSGTIFKINPERQIFVFTTLEQSVAAYHLAFGPDGNLYVSSPTTSSFDHVFRVSPAGDVSSFYRGLGRPQGLAFDAAGNLYVAGSVAGRRGVVRLTPDGREAELVVSGQGIVGLTFTPHRSMVLATGDSLVEIFLDIEGRPLV